MSTLKAEDFMGYKCCSDGKTCDQCGRHMSEGFCDKIPIINLFLMCRKVFCSKGCKRAYYGK